MSSCKPQTAEVKSTQDLSTHQSSCINQLYSNLLLAPVEQFHFLEHQFDPLRLLFVNSSAMKLVDAVQVIRVDARVGGGQQVPGSLDLRPDSHTAALLGRTLGAQVVRLCNRRDCGHFGLSICSTAGRPTATMWGKGTNWVSI